MKVNVGLELSDGQRDALASWLDGKTNKRLATRKDVNELVSGLLEGILDSAEKGDGQHTLSERVPESMAKASHPHRELIERNIQQRGMDAARAKGYWRGWTMKPFKR